MTGSRWRIRILWAAVVAAYVAESCVVLPPFERDRVRPVAPRVLYVAIVSVLALLVLAVLSNRRCRARLRMRPRLSRPSAHGDVYLEAFALKELLAVVALAAFMPVAASFIDREWSTDWLIEASRIVPYLVAFGYACARAHSARVAFAEWGWQRGHSVLRDLSLGIAAGIVAWCARHVSSPVAGPDAIELRFVVDTVLFAPVLEETLYRGVLYRHLRDRLRWLPATLVSATVFALAHSSYQMPHAYVGGLLYALLREWRGSLVAPVAAHMSMNLLAVAAAGAFS